MKPSLGLPVVVALTLAPLASVDAVEPKSRSALSDFRLKNLEGDFVQLSDHKGSVVVISFWATWCVPCLQELPFLEGYYKELKSRGFTVLAITTDGPDTLSKVRQTAKRRSFTMPVLLDQDGAVAAKLNPRGTQPFTMFLDRQGRLDFAHEGYASGDEKKYREIIERLLEEPR